MGIQDYRIIGYRIIGIQDKMKRHVKGLSMTQVSSGVRNVVSSIVRT